MEQAAAPVVQAMTYQPRTEKGAANLDMILNNEFMRKMPPLMGPYTEGAGVAPLRFAPSDLRAMIGKGQLTAQELANLPQDFRNAQSGIQKQNILGEPTLGVKAQGLADTVGDIMAKREMQGLAPIPGVPAEFQPQTKAYAIRNVGEGTVLRGKTVPNVRTSAVAPFAGFNQVLESARPLATDYPTDIIDDFTTRYVHLNEDTNDAWKQFKIDKLAELYPDAPSPSAAMSALNSVTDTAKRHDMTLGWLKEFAEQNPNVPGFDDYMARVKAADDVLEGPISKHIQKYFGTKEDPLLKAAAEGLTFRPAKDIFNNTFVNPPTSVQAARTAGGFKAEGEYDAPYDAQITKVQDLGAQLETLNQNRADIEQQIRRDFPDVNEQTDPATYTPEYIALRNKYNATTNPNNLKAQELKKAKQHLENLRLARAYELASDEALQPRDVSDIKRYFEQPGNYGEAQFFPEHKHYRPDEKLFEVYGGKMDVTGYPKLASLIVDDIMSGKMPLDQVKNLNIDKYVRTHAKARLAKEADARAKEAKKAEELKTYAKERIANAPDNLRFANSSVLELTSASGTVDEIRKDMALDTYCLDHCIGSGGGGGGERHFLTGDERTHTPVVDPLTGEVPALSSGRDREYAEAVARGDTIVPSFRDNETGFPVATLELQKKGATKYRLGYKSGYKNGPINLKYAEDIKNYLNQKASSITDTEGDLSTNTHVYDTMHHNDIGKAARAAGITTSEMGSMDLSSLSRFITAHDLQILKNQQTAGVADMQTDLENLRREREGMASYRSQASDPDFVDTQLADIDSRIRDIEQRMARQPATQQAVQPYREPAIWQQAMQAFRNDTTPTLRNAMGDQQAFEVDETANEIFGNYDHGTVADIVHGLRNGDATVANNEFSARQRELLARELERRLPRPANGDRQIAQARQQPLGPTQRTFAVNAIANELIETERTGRDYSVPGLQSTMHALANGEHDHPELRALPPEQREQITRQVSIRFRELANNLISNRAMQPIPLVRDMTHSRLVRRAYGDIIQEEQGDLESMREHLAITIQALDDPGLNDSIIEELRANRYPERLTQLREMLEAHMDAVLTAINMNEEPHELLNIGNFEPDTQHGANAPALPAPAQQALLPPPAEPTTTTFAQHQRINRAIVNAYTEPLQFATTPGSNRLMQATIDMANTMANNMFGNGSSTDEIARSVLNALNTRRTEITRLRPEVLGVDRDSYNNFLEMLRYAVDDLGAVYGTIDPAQQAQLPAPAPAQQQQQPPRPVHELYAELVGAIEDAIQEGSFDPDMYDNANMAEAIRNGEVGGELNEATPEELRLLADYVERNGFAPGNAPAQQQVANAHPIERDIQTASLTQLQAALRTRELDEVRELAAEAAHPNNANNPRDLRQVAQMVRQYSQGQIWEGFSPVQRELLARALEQHATDIEMQQRPPGHKKGGYITRKPSIDEMRFALMKGK